MASERRIEKLNQLIREELAKIIDREIEFPDGVLTTVTKIEISPDVHYATAFVSILGDKSQRSLEILQKNVYHIQQTLNRRLRMRPVPRIRFAVDAYEKRRESIEQSLTTLKKKGEL